MARGAGERRSGHINGLQRAARILVTAQHTSSFRDPTAGVCYWNKVVPDPAVLAANSWKLFFGEQPAVQGSDVPEPVWVKGEGRHRQGAIVL